MRKFAACFLMALMAIGPIPAPAFAQGHGELPTATPIKHLVVIFNENISFDHYFGTYPDAANLKGEPTFHALPGTPSVNGLTPALLSHNPNLLNTANNNSMASGGVSMAANPFRLAPSQAATSDQDHDYTPEQMAFDGGLMDLFPLSVGTQGPPPSAPPAALTTAITMGYYDGNTVTGLWNYAQHFAMSDNMYDTNFGPSTPGAINVISGQTNGVTSTTVKVDNATIVDGGGGSETLISDADPTGDVCSSKSSNVAFLGNNIGDLLNTAGVSWGFFSGGFDLTITNQPTDTTGCSRSTKSAVTGTTKADYIPHHQPFQYYQSTQNLAHTRPTSVKEIGVPNDTVAHNQYDIHDFFDAVKAGNFPAVAYLKAPGYQDAHAGYSDPLDEQNFVVNTINFLEQQPEWSSTAVIITYDDSDGWYDHQMSPIVNQSQTPADVLNGAGFCGKATPGLAGYESTAIPNAQGRCGYGPRLPFLVISPWAKSNYVSHTIIDQSSVVKFIEDNWLGQTRLGGGSFDAIAGSITDMFDFSSPSCREDKLFLNPTTGEQVRQYPGLSAGFPQ